MDLWKAWGQRIRQARTGRYTQVTLAEALGVDQTTVSAWELGKYPPSDGSKQRLSEVLEQPMADLFSWTPETVA